MYKYIICNNKNIKIDGQRVFNKHLDKNDKRTGDLVWNMSNIDSFNVVRNGTSKI